MVSMGCISAYLCGWRYRCQNREGSFGTARDSSWTLGSVAVVLAVFFCHFLTCGISYSIGVYYVTFLEVFKESHGLTSWIGSLNTGVLCVVGPLASFLIEKTSVRVAVATGGAFASAGLFASAFAPNIYYLFITFGLIAGIGYGLVFTSSVVAISLYFDTKRTLAMGISLAGVGMGNFFYPFFATLMEDYYGWRGALVLTSGLTLHVCAAALLLGDRKVPDHNGNTIKKHKYSDVIKSCNDEDVAAHLRVADSEKDVSVVTEIETLSASKFRPFALYQYWLLHVNVLLFCFSLSVVLTHVVAFAESRGHSRHHATALMAANGIGCVVGRIVLGAIAQTSVIDTYALYSLAYTSAGLATVAMTTWTSLPGLMTLTTVFGLCCAAFGPVLSEVLLLIVGIADFTYGYGFLMISCAAGFLTGAPCAGWLYDVTNVYATSFYLGGACLLTSAAVILPLIFRKHNFTCARPCQQHHYLDNIKSVEEPMDKPFSCGK